MINVPTFKIENSVVDDDGTFRCQITIDPSFTPQLFPHFVRTRNESMKDNERALMMAAMFESGVIPITDANNVMHDFKRVLNQLPPDEALKLKRKFRKVWRKLAKSKNSTEERNKAVYGLGAINPSRSQRRTRKELVYKYFFNSVVRPMLDKFNASVSAQHDQRAGKSSKDDL